jgi:hypothetical protein
MLTIDGGFGSQAALLFEATNGKKRPTAVIAK